MNVFINGIEYGMLTDFSITEKSGNKTASTVNIEVCDGKPFPRAGDIIEIKSGDNSLFWGTCGIPSSPKYKNLNEKRLYKIKCSNANSLLANRIANVAFQNYTVTQIVQALFDTYITEEGITLGQISDIPVTLDIYTAKDFVLQDAIGELADLVSGTWTVTADKKFYFLAADDFPRFPVIINADALLGTDLQHTTTGYKTRTVQYVSGAVDRTSTQTENYVYDGEQKSFILGFGLAQKPVISVNGTQVPPELIGVKGMDDDNDDIVFYFSYDSEIVTYQDLKGYLAAGDNVTFSYTGLFPIRVSAMNHAKIAEIAALTGTSGKREVVNIDKTIATRADAQQLAESLLSRFAEETGKVTFWLLSDELIGMGYSPNDLSLLTQMKFNLPEINIIGDFVITERQLTLNNADPSVPLDKRLKISLTLQNRDYLKSYGETLSDLRRDINRLAIREDDIVIHLDTFSERIAFGEELKECSYTSYFAVPSGCSSIFSPLPLTEDIYP